MITRRRVVGGLAAIGSTCVAQAWSQGSRAKTIALIAPGARPEVGIDAPTIVALRKGVLDSGFALEGGAGRLVVRWLAGDMARARDVIGEVLAEGCDVLVAPSFPISNTASALTRTVPIVTISSDPVGTGLVASLARPGGNVTGVSYMTPDLSAKRLELLKEAVPALRRVAVLANPQNRHEEIGLLRTRHAAAMLGVDIILIPVESANGLDPAFGRLAEIRPSALMPFENPVTAANFRRMIDFSLGARLPTMFELTDFVAAGAFMGYGPSYRELFTRAGQMAGRILRGSDPATLPVEQPTRFELTINLRTARALGIEPPASLIARADEVIE